VPTALIDGTYDVKVTALDNAGNSGRDLTTNELTVDTVGPTVTVKTLMTNKNKPTLSGTVSDPSPSSGIASVTVVVGGQTLPATVNGPNWTVTVPAVLTDGTYDVVATAKDKAGNSATDATTNELTVDSVVPLVTVDKLVTNNNKPTLTGTVNDPVPGSGIAVASVSVVVGTQTLPATVNGSAWSVAVPVALADGTYDVKATAKDNAGNSGADATTNELTVDTANPTVTVTKLVTNKNKPTLTGTVSDSSPSSGILGVTVVVGAQTLPATLSGTNWSVTVPAALADERMT